MDVAEFDGWLSGIAALTPPQRRQAWQTLTFPPSPVARPLNRLGTDVVAELGQRRVDSIGCPHCDSLDVVHWGKASALGRRWCTRQTKDKMAPNPICYAITGWRRTESGRPAANIRFSTATPMAASVCWVAKPRARSRSGQDT